ncbi:multidrug effflux MFS transporter [Dechloromonas sp.]|uniref:multidrug effflux MFS transporter n=1 Tax=Dechloromonas sp. TaxID=1917218 RepID=UPI001202F650|nr:multidrug effflux MFS transporter [Dechloromonas sp.]MBU3697688.1 multidrug effflux MFS transporter [Dechloromonas sp.]TEX44761.1 MAG: Bcr/CflA family drug resistance efflux transporter [Rhodocyclaceae bacterium]
MPEQRRATRGIAALLASLSALGPFSIDTYLPAFPDIARSLGASQLDVQQTLSVYLLSFAVMTLWHGAISDRFGRRRVILWALALFGLASLGCVFASQIEHLWFWRAVQGISAGAGIVISRAIVRDLYDGAAAQRLMSQITMMFALAPAIAPLIGGWLQVLFGWRAIFAFLVLATLALFVACWCLLPETLPAERRQSLRPAYLGRTYWQVLTSPPFLLACLALSMNFAGFFIYVLSAPVFLMQHLGLPETAFLWLFGPAMGGLMAGSWTSGRLAGKLSFNRSIALGYGIMSSAALTNLLLNLGATPPLPWAVAPLFAYTFGMSLAMPCLTIFALDPFPAQRGLAASCQTFLQSGFNGVAAALIAPMLWYSTRSLAIGMGGLMLAGGLAALARYRSRLLPG